MAARDFKKITDAAAAVDTSHKEAIKMFTALAAANGRDDGSTEKDEESRSLTCSPRSMATLVIASGTRKRTRGQ